MMFEAPAAAAALAWAAGVGALFLAVAWLILPGDPPDRGDP